MVTSDNPTTLKQLLRALDREIVVEHSDGGYKISDYVHQAVLYILRQYFCSADVRESALAIVAKRYVIPDSVEAPLPQELVAFIEAAALAPFDHFDFIVELFAQDGEHVARKWAAVIGALEEHPDLRDRAWLALIRQDLRVNIDPTSFTQILELAGLTRFIVSSQVRDQAWRILKNHKHLDGAQKNQLVALKKSLRGTHKDTRALRAAVSSRSLGTTQPVRNVIS